MQEEIKKVELVLENCEVITIEGKHIGDFCLEDITYSINRMACNYIGEHYTCKSFAMSIHRDAALNTKSEWSFGYLDQERNSLNRILEYPDITSIYIYFTNQEQPKQIYVPWGGDSDYNNDYQKSYMNKFGDLFIVVSKNDKLEDIFNLEEIEGADHIDFIWSMYE